jgi:uncharacterized protein YutE (UPF0331/DUF86 family)
MDKELVKRKLSQVNRALKRVTDHRPSSLKEFKVNYDIQDIIYRNWQIIVQNMVDIGSHIISDRGWQTPITMGHVFEILAQNKVIPRSQVKKLRNMVTIRNIIVHDYIRIDHEKVYKHLKTHLRLVRQFGSQILKK